MCRLAALYAVSTFFLKGRLFYLFYRSGRRRSARAHPKKTFFMCSHCIDSIVTIFQGFAAPPMRLLMFFRFSGLASLVVQSFLVRVAPRANGIIGPHAGGVREKKRKKRKERGKKKKKCTLTFRIICTRVVELWELPLATSPSQSNPHLRCTFAVVNCFPFDASA